MSLANLVKADTYFNIFFDSDCGNNTFIKSFVFGLQGISLEFIS